MDLVLLTGIAIALLILIISLILLNKTSSTDSSELEQPNAPRRAQVVRNQRNRTRAAEPQNNEPDRADSDVDDIPHASPDLNSEKIGAKKRAKLEAKAEKKAQRELELKHREDQKKKDALAEEERKRLQEKEIEEERKREEIEKKAREEKERIEHEEYLKLREAFSVEEEGFDECNPDDSQNMLQEFIKFVKDNKVVVLEDLAVQFRLKTQAAIDRIIELQNNGHLSGVIDDRGKFIYISEEELQSVAKFIKQRGRVSITELSENSNNLINLVPFVVSDC